MHLDVNDGESERLGQQEARHSKTQRLVQEWKGRRETRGGWGQLADWQIGRCELSDTHQKRDG